MKAVVSFDFEPVRASTVWNLALKVGPHYCLKGFAARTTEMP